MSVFTSYLSKLNDALEADRDSWKTRAERAEALLRESLDYAGFEDVQRPDFLEWRAKVRELMEGKT